MAKTIAIGSDHGGFELKEKISDYLKKKKHRVRDVGTYSPEPCDYPEFGFEVAKKVSTGKADRGIVICKSGVGMSIIANKLPKVRAGLCGSVADVSFARKHNDINVLVLASMKTDKTRALNITRTWLKTRALKGRHARRVKKIARLERKVFKKTGVS